jgi:hypothetical protein
LFEADHAGEEAVENSEPGTLRKNATTADKRFIYTKEIEIDRHYSV